MHRKKTNRERVLYCRDTGHHRVDC